MRRSATRPHSALQRRRLTIYPNGRGECERCNYAREMPGWKVEAISSGLDNTSHTIKITTPTGHAYLSRAP